MEPEFKQFIKFFGFSEQDYLSGRVGEKTKVSLISAFQKKQRPLIEQPAGINLSHFLILVLPTRRISYSIYVAASNSSFCFPIYFIFLRKPHGPRP
jgi:hypothetical protein